MAREIEESDWKVFRELHGIALERFCRQVIEEVQSATASCTSDYHDCYTKLFELMRRRDKELSTAFDDLRRSTALMLLANIKSQGLLTEEELMRLSEETRDVVGGFSQ
jgi:hypothetical protein